MKNFLDEHSRTLFFHAHFLSLIDYSSAIWDNASDAYLKYINRLRKIALKLMFDVFMGDHLE